MRRRRLCVFPAGVPTLPAAVGAIAKTKIKRMKFRIAMSQISFQQLEQECQEVNRLIRLDDTEFLATFRVAVNQRKQEFLDFLLEQKEQAKRTASERIAKELEEITKDHSKVCFHQKTLVMGVDAEHQQIYTLEPSVIESALPNGPAKMLTIDGRWVPFRHQLNLPSGIVYVHGQFWQVNKRQAPSPAIDNLEGATYYTFHPFERAGTTPLTSVQSYEVVENPDPEL